MPHLIGTRLAVRPDGSPYYVPLIRVRIESTTRYLDLVAIVDSGADHSMIPASVAQALGVEFASLPPGIVGVGASGQFETRIAPGRITFDGRLVRDSLPVAAPDTLPVVLLGREDFFRNHVIRFSWHREPPTFDVDPVSRK